MTRSRRYRILVLDADTGAALAVVQSLGRAGHEVAVAGAAPGCWAHRSRFASSRLVYPDPMVDREAFIGWIRRQAGYDLVIPPTDRTVLPIHAIRDEPVLSGRVALPPAAAVEIGFDKERTRQAAADVGLASPPSVLVDRVEGLANPIFDEWLEAGGVVVKSVRSKVWRGQRGEERPVAIALDRARLRSVAARVLADTPVQVQRWVPGCGVGINVLVDRGEVVLVFAHERIHEVPLTGGASSYRRSIPPPPDMLDATRRLMKAIGWHGVAMVEFRRETETGLFHLIELNGRFWGSLPLALYAGVDFPRALVALLLDGERPVQPPLDRTVYARNLTRDVAWYKLGIAQALRDRKRAGGPAERGRTLQLDRPLGRSLLEWHRVLTGRETWDGASIDDPGPLWSELGALAGEQWRSVARHGRQLLDSRAARSAWRRPLGPHGRLLVLCAGNICRSPYAAARLRARFPSAEVVVESAGLMGPAGRPAHPRLRELALERGVDLGAHQSRVITDAELAGADLILVMNGEQAAEVRIRAPSAQVRWLGALLPGPAHIDDPIDMDDEGTRVVLDRIDEAIDALGARLGLAPG